MPAIKLKKVTAEYLAEKEKVKELEKKKNLEDVAAEKEEEESAKGKSEEKKPHNFLDVQVLFDKRKRTLPAVEQALVEWLDSNMEKKEEVHIPLPSLYEYYSEVCQMQGTSVVDIPVFNKYIRDKFGKFFGFKETSPYKGLIKERKHKEKTKVQGETLQLKMRDIIAEVIGDAGNPRKGVRFNFISKAIVQKYPAKQVNVHPKILRSALERGVYYGHVELVRGVGMCGYYRLPGDPTINEEEKPDKKKKDETKDNENGAVENGEDKPADEEEAKSGEDKTKDADTQEEEGVKKQKKKRKPQKKRPVDAYRSVASRHSAPQRVEDSFQLAITFQSDPKEASVQKIKSYIARYYHRDIDVSKLKRSLDAGVEKGLWEQTKGSSSTGGTYHLLSDTFQPGYSEHLQDQIAQALVACHEPKEASAKMIKKYIVDYHPKLNVDQKPHLFKHALERACTKGKIRQMTGIGASGSYRLVDHFYPSPAILAGDSSDEESSDEEEDSDEEEVEYVPRPTKRGRQVMKPERHAPNRSAPQKKSEKPKKTDAKKAKPSKAAPSKAKKSKQVDSDSDDEDEVVEYTPRKSKSRGGGESSPSRGKKTEKKPAPKSAKKSASKTKPKSPSKPKPKVVLESDSEEEDEEEPVPKKGKAKPAATPSAKGSKSTKSSSKKPSKKIEVTEDSDEEDVIAQTPVVKRGKATPSKKAVKRKLPQSDSEEVSDEEMYVPKPSKRRGGGSSEPVAKPSPSKKHKGRK